MVVSRFNGEIGSMKQPIVFEICSEPPDKARKTPEREDQECPKRAKSSPKSAAR